MAESQTDATITQLRKPCHSKYQQEALLSQRGCAMLHVCQQLASTIQYLERSLVLLVTAASDLPLWTIKFCSVVHGVTSRLSVINKIHWCVNWWHLLIMGDIRCITAITCIPSSRCRHTTVQQWPIPKPDSGRKLWDLHSYGGHVGTGTVGTYVPPHTLCGILPQRSVWKN